MTQAIPSAKINGFAPQTLDKNAQAAFYEQLLQLRDAVLSDRHPRIKLPADVQHRLKTTKAFTPASSNQLPGLKTDHQDGIQANSPQYNGLTPSNGMRNALAFEDNRAAHASQASLIKPHPSGIDPVLLTKSDDLIRAEIQLKRQRIEKQLKEKVDQQRQLLRRNADAEPGSLIDLPEILQKAWDVVKPVSGLKPTTNVQTTASDSFDENSYYSSQVNDWSSEASADSRRVDAAAVDLVVPVGVRQSATGMASSASISKHHPSEIERHLDPQVPSNRSPAFAEPGTSFYTTDAEGAYDAEREDSEEYSPPAADAFSGADGADADAMDLDDDSSEFVPEEPTLPSPQAPVITSHLTHIAAPQPARVSPLALAKPPILNQSIPKAQPPQTIGSRMSEDSTTSPHNSRQHSPTAPYNKKQKARQRKKRREVEAVEKSAEKAVRKSGRAGKHRVEATAARSPEPYIKPEPVSPPPFANMSELHPAKKRMQQELPSDVQIVSPHEFRPRPRQTYYQEAPPPQALGYASPSSPTIIRVTSPAGHVRPRRDDQDLRRVASLHAAQRPMSPIYSPVGPYRTMSQTYLHQQNQPRASYHQEAPRGHSQYIRSERSLSPPQLRAAREPYVQRLQSPALMPPPPPRRIVVDQYGNKYVAAEEVAPAPALSRMSVAPPSRHDGEMAYERAPSRASVGYTAQAAPSGYGDAMMAPPSVRRIVVPAEADVPDYRAYRQREYSRAPEAQYYREEPIYMRDGLPARPTPSGQRASAYPTEHAAPPNYARAYSVRPEAESVRYVSRAPSAMPQTEYIRMTESAAPGPAPSMRAGSVAPGPEYGREVEGRYPYGHAAAYPMAPPPPPPQRIEIYVDQYGREVRRGAAY